jgi:hypothetical protein
VRPTLLALALGLNLLVLVVGCGEEGEPAATAPMPATAPVTTQAPGGLTPEELPDLALDLADLPEGFSVRSEGAVPAVAPIVAGFRRAFDPGEARLGDSLVADVTSDIVLFDSSEQAQAALDSVLAALLVEDVERNFADVIRASAGIEATNLEGQTLVPQGLGDGAVVARATFDSDAGRAEAVLVLVRIGRLQHALFVIGPAGRMQVEDAVELARAVIPRLRTAAEGGFAA